MAVCTDGIPGLVDWLVGLYICLLFFCFPLSLFPETPELGQFRFHILCDILEFGINPVEVIGGLDRSEGSSQTKDIGCRNMWCNNFN